MLWKLPRCAGRRGVFSVGAFGEHQSTQIVLPPVETDAEPSGLGVEHDVADAEACQMEHALSLDTQNRWLEYLEAQGINVEE